jgi:hypothetical protein
MKTDIICYEVLHYVLFKPFQDNKLNVTTIVPISEIHASAMLVLLIVAN